MRAYVHTYDIDMSDFSLVICDEFTPATGGIHDAWRAGDNLMLWDTTRYHNNYKDFVRLTVVWKVI